MELHGDLYGSCDSNDAMKSEAARLNLFALATEDLLLCILTFLLLPSGQHVALHNSPPTPGYIGLICTRVSPVEVAQNAIDDARSACMRTYGTAPEVHVYGDPHFSFA